MNISHLTPTFSDIKTWVRAAAVSVNQLITGKQDKSDNLTALSGLDLTGHSGDAVVVTAGEDGFELSAVSGGSGLADGDYGDVTVSSSGTVISIDAGVVSTTELGGDITSAGKAILDDSTAGDQLTTLGLSANGKSLVTAADYAAMKALLDLEIGTDVQAYDADLGALAGIGSNGLLARTGAGTASARTITAGTGISVTNGDGVSGNPTVGLSFSGARVYKSATLSGQNITSNTAITFDSEDFDTDNYHSTSSNTERLTVPSSGYYAASATLYLDGNTTDQFVGANIFRFNSSGTIYATNLGSARALVEVGATTAQISMTTGPVLCAAGDYFVCSASVEADTTVNIRSECTFAIHRLG